MEDMDAIYRRHVQTVYKFLLAQCRDPDLAEELTQETFYQAVRSIDRFDGSCKLSIWLCQIAKHLWYQQLRKRQKAPVPLDNVPDSLAPSAEEGLLEQEGRLSLLRQIHQLPELLERSSRFSLPRLRFGKIAAGPHTYLRLFRESGLCLRQLPFQRFPPAQKQVFLFHNCAHKLRFLS